jgi:hypothetical protein
MGATVVLPATRVKDVGVRDEEKLLNHSQVRSGGRMIDVGKGAPATFDSEKLR